MSLAVTVLKNSAVLLLFLLFISCGTKNKEYANNVFPYSQFPQEKELKGEVIELDTALFRYPFRIRIEGDKAIVLDLHGSDYYGHLFQYPSFRYLSSFGRRGDSPLEMLSMENFRLHNHTLWTLDANKSELTRLDFSSSGDSLLREETVALDEDILRPLDFAIYNDTTFVIPDYSGESRFLKVDCKGKLIEKIGTIPTTNKKALQEARPALAQAWRSFLDYNSHNSVLATVTHDAIYAVFHGTSFKDIARQSGRLSDGGKYIYVFSLKGEPLCKYVLDHYIYGIWVDEVTKTIMATDVNNDQPILKFSFG